MFQTAALVALPVIVLSAAAFFILRSLRAEGMGTSSGPCPPSRIPNQAAPDSNTSRDTSGLRRRGPRSRTRQENIDNECVICFGDHQPLVELYPCQHKNMCEKCVVKLISCDMNCCPLCRRRIQGFV